jgi:DNA-binding CsgD family transcriptional regulator
MPATFQQSITRPLKLSKREFEVLRLLVKHREAVTDALRLSPNTSYWYD